MKIESPSEMGLCGNPEYKKQVNEAANILYKDTTYYKNGTFVENFSSEIPNSKYTDAIQDTSDGIHTNLNNELLYANKQNITDVYIIPHTHADTGRMITFEEYYEQLVVHVLRPAARVPGGARRGGRASSAGAARRRKETAAAKAAGDRRKLARVPNWDRSGLQSKI